MPTSHSSPRPRFGLTRAQANVWLAEQIDPAGGRFTIGELIEIEGPVDPTHFAAAIRQVMRETEVALVRFVEEGGVVHQELDLDMPWTVAVHDVRGEADPRSAVDAAVAPVMARGFPLTGGEPLFAHMLFLGDGPLVVVLGRPPHRGRRVVRADGRHAGRRGLQRARGGRDGPGPGRPARSPGSSSSTRATAPAAAGARDAAWWRERLAGAPDPVRLSRTDAAPGRRTLRREVELSPQLDAQLRAACTSAGRRPSGFVTAMLAAYLHRVTGARDLVLGLPVTARSGPAMRTLPGMLANIVPLRLAVRPETTGAELVDDRGARAAEGRAAPAPPRRGPVPRPAHPRRDPRPDRPVRQLHGLRPRSALRAARPAGPPRWPPGRWTTSPSPSTTGATAAAC